MKISGSFLKIQNDQEKIQELNEVVDYMHYDIMDGIFVSNTTLDFERIKDSTTSITKPKDVHLMVKDIYKYIEMYQELKPEFITFHFEATKEIDKVIEYIKSKNIKVGIAINPDTDVTVLKPYLNKIDLVLLMSVMPGAGGQAFIDITSKINWLKSNQKDFNYLIEVDGGINENTITKVKDVDMAVVGSYITNSDNYEKKVSSLKKHNAFTLAELMGVIVILSILAVIVTLTVDKSIKNSREKTCEAQEKNLIEAAKTWGIDNPTLLPTRASNNKKVYITTAADSLTTKGYVDDDLKNPMTNAAYTSSDYVNISVAATDSDYDFKVVYGNAAHSCNS